MRVLILGATGGSGREAMRALLDAGHHVTALVRSPISAGERLQVIVGDALFPDDVSRAVKGQDAVVVALGIRESSLRIRLRGPAATSLQVRSLGTQHVVAAMKQHGVQRLIVQSSYGVGPTRDRLPFWLRMIYALLLKPQIADTELQERVVRDSGLQWTLVQPVGLNDGAGETAFVSPDGATKSMAISRRAVGRVLAGLVTSPDHGQTLSLSS
jgi:uncharacterized protein YbjT (DUF2867 family)